MRNWNSIEAEEVFNEIKKFYITYEELKQPSDNSFFKKSNLILHYLWGIETVSKGISIIQRKIVFTLPMRNWNIDLKQDDILVFTFLHYLWGIETIQAFSLSQTASLFLHYLWGIETNRLW